MSDNKIINLDERREEKETLYPILEKIGIKDKKDKQIVAKELREAGSEIARAAVINKKQRERK